MRVELHPEARAELRAVAIWSDERRARLGEEFVAEVSATLNRIANAPASFPLWPNVTGTAAPVRKAPVHRFPYVIAFEAHADNALVLAVAHARLRPLYWLTRAHRGSV